MPNVPVAKSVAVWVWLELGLRFDFVLLLLVGGVMCDVEVIRRIEVGYDVGDSGVDMVNNMRLGTDSVIAIARVGGG